MSGEGSRMTQVLASQSRQGIWVPGRPACVLTGLSHGTRAVARIPKAGLE
jgi:hypothetical protein